MAGKVFEGVISSQMRFKKTFFPTNLWGGEKDDLDKFSPKTTPLKFRG